jgi:transcriptional regulator with XRE-family HTH domain
MSFDINEYIGNLDTKILQTIRQVREDKGISRQTLADDLGFAPSTYADMETGKTNFTLPRLLAVLKYLAITDIFEPQKPQTNPPTQDLVVIDNFEAFIQKFAQQTHEIARQTHEIAQLRQENTEIKALLNEILSRLPKNP